MKNKMIIGGFMKIVIGVRSHIDYEWCSCGRSYLPNTGKKCPYCGDSF